MISTRIWFLNLILSDADWADIKAPINCNWFFIHIIGVTKPPILISSNTANPTCQDCIESGWTDQIPMGPGLRWKAGDYMFSLKATNGNGGCMAGLTFVL